MKFALKCRKYEHGNYIGVVTFALFDFIFLAYSRVNVSPITPVRYTTRLAVFYDGRQARWGNDRMLGYAFPAIDPVVEKNIFKTMFNKGIRGAYELVQKENIKL